MPTYHDITLAFSPDLPGWPGDPMPVVEKIRTIAEGSSCNVTRLDSHVHFATHVDAPLHFIEGAAAVDELPLDSLLGPCRVAHLPDVDVIDAAVLESLALPPGTERLLFRTRNSELWNDPAQGFREDYVALSSDGAEWAVGAGIRLVGVDYLSVERFKEPGRPTHNILLEAGVVALEGLDLRGIESGAYGLMCLPMKIKGADGAPARVVLVEE